MIDKLGLAGVVGALLAVGGIALVAWEAPIVAAGLALTLVGIVLVVRALLKSMLGSLGMGGML